MPTMKPDSQTSPAGRVQHIVGANLVSALGDDGATSAAAWISGRRCQKFVELQDAKLYTAPASDIAGGTTGAARLQSLLQALLNNPPMVLQQTSAAGPQGRDTHCHLVLPAWLTPAERDALTGSALALVRRHTPADRTVSASHGVDAGPLASHAALHTWMRRSPPQPAPRLFLVAVDSLCEATVLRDHHAQGWVAHTRAKKLDTAGEAAAYVVLDDAPSMRHIPRGHMALHLPAVSASASAPRWNAQQIGDGKLLAQAIDQALLASSLGLDNLGHGIDDNDDQPWRNEDRQAALRRLSQQHQVSSLLHDLGAAERIGHIGVATGVTHWALAHTLQTRALMDISTVLSCVQHRDGACAAVVMERGK